MVKHDKLFVESYQTRKFDEINLTYLSSPSNPFIFLDKKEKKRKKDLR